MLSNCRARLLFESSSQQLGEGGEAQQTGFTVETIRDEPATWPMRNKRRLPNSD
jgi:hypothetical protein